jgi:MFS family permease
VLRYGRDFALAFLAQFWFTIAATLWAQYARWVHFLGGDESDVGWIVGVGVAFALAVRPWLAEFINRIGARRAWLIGLGLLAASALANLGLTRIGPAIYFLQAVSTLALAICYASGLLYVAEIAPPEKRTEMIGAFGVAGFAGVLVGPYLGDLALGGVERDGGAFVRMFVGANAMLALAIFLVWRLHDPAVDRAPGSLRPSAFLQTLKRHWPGAVVWVNAAFGVCMAVPFRFLARYIDSVQLTAVGVGGFFLIYATVGIVVRLSMRDRPERWGLKPVIVASLAAFAGGLLAFPFVSPQRPWLIVVPAVVCGAAHAFMFHCMIALTLAPFPPEKRGSGTVLALMMQDLGQVIGMPILGVLADRDFNLLFVAAAGTAATTACYFGFAGRNSRRPTSTGDVAVQTPDPTCEAIDLDNHTADNPAPRAPSTSSCHESPTWTADSAPTPASASACRKISG